ncbi:4Fe-4S dicluster domain-containing protein [Chloroflexota bacterium]
MPIGIVFMLTAIALVFGLAIYFVNRYVPHKVKGLEKTEEVSAILPGMNCGACGRPGCFAYAQALTAEPELLADGDCAVALQAAETVEKLQAALGVTLDAAAMRKKALVHCNGNSEVIRDYSGVETCKGATQLSRGYKKCPFACLGLGDCMQVCPEDAISLRTGTDVVVVDPQKCTGCGLCIAECSMNLIELVPEGTKVALLCNYGPLRDIPGREKCDFGCIHCRKCFKACEVEAIEWNKDRGIPEFDIEKCTLRLSCIEACPNSTLAEFAGIKTFKQKEPAPAGAVEE